MGKTYTGIDIGSSSLKIAICDGKIIKAMAVENFPTGLVLEDRIVSFDAMADFIKETVAQIKGAEKNVACTIHPGATITRRLRLPAMTEKELLLNLPYEFRDYISSGKEKYLYDYSVFATELDDEGKLVNMDILAVAAPKQLLEDYMTMFRRAGLRLKIALPSIVAYQNLITDNPSAKQNCCIVEFSHLATLLHFFERGIYDVTRTIDIGGIHIDRAIAQQFNIEDSQVFGYKSANFENVLAAEAVTNIYEAISIEISRALSYYSFNNLDETCEVVYCCGGGSRIQGLVDTVSSSVSVPLVSITDIMLPAANDDELRVQCCGAVGATLEVGVR